MHSQQCRELLACGTYQIGTGKQLAIYATERGGDCTLTDGLILSSCLREAEDYSDILPPLKHVGLWANEKECQTYAVI
jgi:hypothetical protein